jgi:hypothetical protein
MHHALPPSELLDGAHPCCLRLAAVGGARPRGGWRPSAIARLQGFSSYSLAAFPHQWSSVGMIISLVVGRSKPGCGLCPALSFKDLHHPGWGGGQGELGPTSAWAGDPLLPPVFGGEGHPPAVWRRRPPAMRGKANCCFLDMVQLSVLHPGRRSCCERVAAVTDLAEGANFDNAGLVGRERRQLQHAWHAGSAGSGAASDVASCRLVRAWLSVHRTGDCRVAHRSGMSAALPASPTAPGDRLRRRTPLGRRSCSWIVLSSLQHDASVRRPVPARPRGLEWGSAGAGWGSRHSSAWRWRAGGRCRRC